MANDVKFPHGGRSRSEEVVFVSGVLLSNRVNRWTGQQGREFEGEVAVFVVIRCAVIDDCAQAHPYDPVRGQ